MDKWYHIRRTLSFHLETNTIEKVSSVHVICKYSILDYQIWYPLSGNNFPFKIHRKHLITHPSIKLPFQSAQVHLQFFLITFCRFCFIKPMAISAMTFIFLQSFKKCTRSWKPMAISTMPFLERAQPLRSSQPLFRNLSLPSNTLSGSACKYSRYL